MQEDFEHLEFHHLQSAHHDSIHISDITGFEGYHCMDCHEHCPGFKSHPWRHGCAHCKCPPLRHEVLSKNVATPFARMNVEEINPPHHTEYEKALEEGYAWVPRGLDSAQIHTFMDKLHKEHVPNLKGDDESIGSNDVKYRDVQLVSQLPLQDFHFDHLKFIEKNSENVFKYLNKKRLEGVVGIGAVKAAVSGHGHCNGCSHDIEHGEMVVFAERLGSEHQWHPSCFKCSVDGETLVDLIYFSHEGKVFCGRHYHEQIKPRCFGCDELIIKGGYIKAMDESWHSEHFCCWDCDTSLSGEKYIPCHNHPYCEPCYNKNNAHVCTNCTEYIGAGCRDLHVRGNHYHENCFICSHCGHGLKAGEFSFMEDKLFCHHCRGIDVEKCKACHSCHHEFKDGEKKVGVGGEYYHEWCFLCAECEHPIGTNTFVRREDRPLCHECFNKSAKVCSTCETIIKGPTLSLGERHFHAHCFLCFHCKGHLEEKVVEVTEGDGHDGESTHEKKRVQFYKHDHEPYCEHCYLEHHAMRCAHCHHPMGSNTKFVEYDEKHWHSTCFTCSACEIELAGGVKFVNRHGDRFCMDCK